MQNKHIEHPEDTILTGDLNALDWFEAAGTLSVKMDGAPAIVWGRNPATGNHFVGTKSVFNKVKIKINESHAELMLTTKVKLQKFCTLVLIGFLIQTPFIRGILLDLAESLNTLPTLSLTISEK